MQHPREGGHFKIETNIEAMEVMTMNSRSHQELEEAKKDSS